ncbi:MAG: hypothetical protein ACFFDI_11615 [Promethearchaeota archaeon]
MPASTRNLLFLSSPGQVGKLKNFVSKLKEKTNEEYFIIVGNPETSNLLREENMEHKLITEYSPPNEVLANKGMRWIKALQNGELRDKKNIKELFTYDGVSLWWLIDYWLYDSSFFISPSLSEMVRQVEIVLRLAELEKPSKVTVVGNETWLSKIMCLVFASKGVPVSKTGGSQLPVLREKISLHVKPSVKLFLMFGRLCVRKTVWGILKAIYRSKSNSPVDTQNHVLMLSADYWKMVGDPVTLTFSMGDGYLHSVASELRRNPENKVTFVGVVRGFDMGIRVMKERLVNSDLKYKPFESYVGILMVLKVIRELWKEKSRWKSLVNSDNFKKLSNYDDVFLFELLKPRYSFFFERFPFIVMLYIEMAKNLVKIEKPNIIVISEETVMDGRALTIASKAASVPILCVQHGIIGYPGVVDCEHDKGDIESNGDISAPYCPIPDKMAVYGEIYKRKCMEVSKYPEAILEVTGSPRYDILAHFDEIYNKADIFARLSELSGGKLNPQKKIVLLLTQPLRSYEERELVLRYTYRAVKKFKDIQLIVKLHPAEFSSAMHRRIAHEEGVDEVVIIERFDTYELLYICDLAISAFSTAQLEAVALGKPTISIDVFRRSYWAGLDKDEVIASVVDEDSLTQLIQSVLFNTKFSKDLDHRILKFKYNHLCKVDGLATERIVKLIHAQMSEFAQRHKIGP